MEKLQLGAAPECSENGKSTSDLEGATQRACRKHGKKATQSGKGAREHARQLPVYVQCYKYVSGLNRL